MTPVEASPTCRRVHVFAPFLRKGGALVSPGYDTPEYRSEVASWFDTLGLDWCWVPVTLDRIEELVADVPRTGSVVFNLCDGDEADGFPGASVIDRLEGAGLAFTGADAAFYRLSSSKIAMKERFLTHGVRTAPYLRVGCEADIARVAEKIGFPVILKLDMSADGLGLKRTSVVASEAELRKEVERLNAESLAFRGIYAERFVAGREFTALIVEDEGVCGGLKVFPPIEYIYAERVPIKERILFRGYRDMGVDGLPRKAGSLPRCVHEVAPIDIRERIVFAACAAFRAVDAKGYARIDMRRDMANGEIYILEVNANCSLSREERSIMPALRAANLRFEDLIADILRAGLKRSRARS